MGIGGPGGSGSGSGGGSLGSGSRIYRSVLLLIERKCSHRVSNPFPEAVSSRRRLTLRREHTWKHSSSDSTSDFGYPPSHFKFILFHMVRSATTNPEPVQGSLLKQFLQPHSERIRQFHQGPHRRIPAPALQVGHVGPLDRSPF